MKRKYLVFLGCEKQAAALADDQNLTLNPKSGL
jgi:hypothetical protein